MDENLVGRLTETELRNAAETAWQEWHDSVGFAPDEDDNYIPEMSPLWHLAFRTGVQWVQERGPK